MTEWTTIGPFTDDCTHLWLIPWGAGWGDWMLVMNEHDVYEFRQCVLCDTKQVRELPS